MSDDARTAARRDKVIVLIEDNRPIRSLVSHIIEDAGYTLEVASDGELGLEVVFERAPDLVLLDLDLPGLDGFAVLERIRGNPRTKATSVVAFTASAMAGDRGRVLSAGFDGYISKPIDPDGFIADVEDFLSFNERD